MFKELREKMGKDASKPKRAKKPKLPKGVSPLTPEQISDRNQKKRMKERAAILSIAQVDATTFQVLGGDNPHVVRVTDGWITCDCVGWNYARNHNCSHVMKYRLTFGDLKK